MTAALAVSGVLGAGLFLLALAQPFGRPRPDLGARLERMSARGRLELEERAERAGPPMFASGVLERLLRPVLDDFGDALARALRRLGVERGDLEQRLALAWPELRAAQFRGQQLATGGVLALAVPAMNLLGVHPLGPWPFWTWLVAGGVGFAAPSWQLASRLRARRAGLLAELPRALDLLVIGASAGLSPEQALAEAAGELDGALGAELRAVVRTAGVGGVGYADGLQAFAEGEGIPELRSFADTWRMAHAQGLPLAPALLSLADGVRERDRARLLEEGGRAEVRMLVPVALFIFPVFLVVLLYPAGVALLGLGS